ncbi:MAG: 5'-nucleotidase C-terminal domain-containing protein [Magnetococcales bacterium]|nr:5'-nucleotidase C-terminal domain-containing protein [Magnetococcales bacterium]
MTLLHICDVYQIEPSGWKEKMGGFARLKSLLDTVRREDPEALLFLPGDFLSPSLMSGVFKGRQMIELLNGVALDYASPGNHEFDFGMEVFEQRLAESRFPWLISNMSHQGEPVSGMPRYTLRKINGVMVGVFAVITPETGELAHATAHLTFTDPQVVAKEMVALLRGKGAELVVAMSHLDYADDLALAREVPGIDLILGGHDHIVRIERVGSTPVVESGSDLEVVGRVDVLMRPNGPEITVTHIPLDASIPDDPAVKRLVDGFGQRLESALGETIGRTEVTLDATSAANRSRETNVGALITDAMRQAVDADVAIHNGGGIRSDTMIAVGTLSLQNVHAMLPFGNLLMKLEISGSALKEMLEHGVSQMERGKGRFLQVSGVRFSVDPSRQVGRRVSHVRVGEEPLHAKRRYTLAVNDYLAKGGDGFSMLKGAKVLIPANHGALLTDVVSAWIRERGSISPVVTGRIQIRERE